MVEEEPRDDADKWGEDRVVACELEHEKEDDECCGMRAHGEVGPDIDQGMVVAVDEDAEEGRMEHHVGGDVGAEIHTPCGVTQGGRSQNGRDERETYFITMKQA